MRMRNRDINVVSMSALDLFAGALGAFILLTTVTLPYFPNTQQSSSSSDSAAVSGIGTTDVVLVVDTTGSMGGVVSGMRREMADLANILSRLSPSAAMGIVDFKDRCDPRGAVAVHPLQRLDSAAVNRLRAFVDGMSARNTDDPRTCNHDQEEAVGEGMRAAIAQPWRKDALKRVIVVITDNPAYSDETRRVLQDAQKFHDEGGMVATVFVASPGARGRSFLEELARAGGGAFMPEGGSFTATVLTAITS